MDDQSFRQLVAEMRHAQKEFFRTKSGAALENSKMIEKRVDRELTEGEQDQKQKKLFGD